MAFSVDTPFLKDILEQIGKGELQLPDFQRGWVWNDPHISSLIASISLSYPIGAVMFLEAGGVRFKPRAFEGVTLSPPSLPKTFVLDGQQRLTSTYLALKSGSPGEDSNRKRSRYSTGLFFRYGEMLGCHGRSRGGNNFGA
jgi:uncharacterized protein with ParB-like and HNH nuclease domain